MAETPAAAATDPEATGLATGRASVAEWIQNFNLAIQGVFEQMAFKVRRLVAGLPTPVGVRPFEGRRVGVRGDARAQRATLRRPRGDPVVPGAPRLRVGTRHGQPRSDRMRSKLDVGGAVALVVRRHCVVGPVERLELVVAAPHTREQLAPNRSESASVE